MKAYTQPGLKFKIGKYRICLHWRFIDISNGMYGRTTIFPWGRK